MQYLGGKSRIAKQLAEVIESVRHPGQWVWDAFCGGLSMTKALRAKGPVWSTDACVPLISMYQALNAGWDPPSTLTEDEWRSCKALPDSDPMKAFAGFACSFGGKWFGGYGGRSRPKYREPIKGARKTCLAKRGLGPFAVVDFLSVQPQACEAILYLDPPYSGTQGYEGVQLFDSDRFVQRVREWSRWTNVFVSEYSFPIGECVWAGRSSTTLNAGKSGSGFDAVERLYYLGPG